MEQTTLLANIIYLLNMDDHYGVSDNIDIAKGKYKLPQTFREGWMGFLRKKRRKK